MLADSAADFCIRGDFTQVVGASVDNVYSHLAWEQQVGGFGYAMHHDLVLKGLCLTPLRGAQPRKTGGVGALKYPLLSDITKSISQNYGEQLLHVCASSPSVVSVHVVSRLSFTGYCFSGMPVCWSPVSE